MLIAPRPARGLGRRSGEGLRAALREQGANEAPGRPAARLVLDKGMRPADVAGLPGRGEDWAGTWVARHAEGALRGLSRPGRLPLVPQHDVPAFLWGVHRVRVPPGSLRDAIEEGAGVRHGPDSTRRPMRLFGFSRKRPTLVHASRAGPGREAPDAPQGRLRRAQK